MLTGQQPIIFVNYRRTDAGWPAEYLTEKIELYFGRDSVFLDVRSIEAGDDFSADIEANLQRTKALVVLIGPRWLFLQDKYGRRKIDNEEDWVRREIREGIENKNCTVVPVLLDDTQLPNDEEALPKDIAKLLKLQSISIRQSKSDADIESLIKIIEKKGFKRQSNKAMDTEQSSEVNYGIFDAPKLSDALLRVTLIQDLKSAITNNPVVVIGGLSGCGKTYLMSSYLDNVEKKHHYRTVLWYDPSPSESIDSLLTQLSIEIKFTGLSAISRCKELISFLNISNSLLVIDDFHLVDQTSYSILVELAIRAGIPCRLVLLSQIYVELPSVTEVPFHLVLKGYSVKDTWDFLNNKSTGSELAQWAEELENKTDGLPFAVSLFCKLVIEFNHAPKELRSGSMTEAKRIRDWYSRIITFVGKDASLLLPRISLLNGPFNIGVVKCLAQHFGISKPVEAIDELQRAYLVTKYSLYRWKVHDLVSYLGMSTLPSMQKEEVHYELGRYFLRGLSRRPEVFLEKEEFLCKVKAYRHFCICKKEQSESERLLNEISSTAKAIGAYRLLVDLSGDALRDWPNRNKWIDYHHAQCWLILGNPSRCRQVIEPLIYDDSVNRNDTAKLNFSRLYAEALGSLGQEYQAIKLLRKVIHPPNSDSVGAVPLAHAKSSLAWLLTRVKQYN